MDSVVDQEGAAQREDDSASENEDADTDKSMSDQGGGEADDGKAMLGSGQMSDRTDAESAVDDGPPAAEMVSEGAINEPEPLPQKR